MLHGYMGYFNPINYLFDVEKCYLYNTLHALYNSLCVSTLPALPQSKVLDTTGNFGPNVSLNEHVDEFIWRVYTKFYIIHIMYKYYKHLGCYESKYLGRLNCRRGE